MLSEAADAAFVETSTGFDGILPTNEGVRLVKGGILREVEGIERQRLVVRAERLVVCSAGGGSSRWLKVEGTKLCR